MVYQETGTVSNNLQAFLTIELTGGAMLDCLLDTGFDGALVLPRNFVESNSILIVGDETFTAAEGNEFTAEMGVAEIKWLGEISAFRVLVSEVGDALIGVELLADALLEIDYANRTVKITK